MKTPLAAGVVVMIDNKVLAFRRTKDGQLGIPCGKIDPFECPRSAAIRECLEETGYHVRLSPKQSYIANSQKDGDYPVAAYLAEIIDFDAGPSVPSHAGEGTVVWVTKEQLQDSDYGDYNMGALKHFDLLS